MNLKGRLKELSAVLTQVMDGRGPAPRFRRDSGKLAPAGEQRDQGKEASKKAPS